MRSLLVVAAGLLAFAAGAARAADAKTPELSSRECGLSTPYNVQVDGGGVWLYRREGSPEEIFFHDGTLSVDHQVQAVSDADARRLRQMEDDARLLMPQVAGIARDSVDITFDALTAVMQAMTGSRRKVRKVERHREDALEHIEDSLGKGRWDQDVFGDTFEANVEQVAEEVAGSMARSVLWAVFTGRADKLEARADRLDGEIDQWAEVRTAALEDRARSLCTQVVALRELQDALDYRYHGAPLVMLDPDAAPAPNATGEHVVARDNGDSGTSTAIPAGAR